VSLGEACPRYPFGETGESDVDRTWWKEVKVPVDGKLRSLTQETLATDGGRCIILLTAEFDVAHVCEPLPS
jgi:hypothetical protein